MEKTLYKNGFIVKSFKDFFSYLCDDGCSTVCSKYIGVDKNETWPLDTVRDAISLGLEKETFEKWFMAGDAFWIVPEIDFIQRYRAHCSALGIETYCLQIESRNSCITATDSLNNPIELGYEFADYGLYCAPIREDAHYPELKYSKIWERLNKYGLFNSFDDALEHIEIRDSFLQKDINFERYYGEIVRVSIEKEDYLKLIGSKR